jgi:hypothetical protein
MKNIIELTENHKYEMKDCLLYGEDFEGTIDAFEIGSITLLNTVTNEIDKVSIWHDGEESFHVFLPTGGPDDDEDDDLDEYPLDAFGVHLFSLTEGDTIIVGMHS